MSTCMFCAAEAPAPSGAGASESPAVLRSVAMGLEMGLSSNVAGVAGIVSTLGPGAIAGRPFGSQAQVLAKLSLLGSPDFAEPVARARSVHELSVIAFCATGVQVVVSEETASDVVSTGDTVRWLARLRLERPTGEPEQVYEVGLRVQKVERQRTTLLVCRPVAPGKEGTSSIQASVGFALSILRGKRLYDASLAALAETRANEGKDRPTGKLVGLLDKLEWDHMKTGGTSYGCSLDVAGAVTLGDHVTVGAAVHNLVGFMEWDGTTHIEGIINTDTVVMDEQGYVSYAPTMSGRQFTDNVRYDFTRTLEIGLAACVRGTRADMRLHYDGSRVRPEARVRLGPLRRALIVEAGCSGTEGMGQGPLWSLAVSRSDGQCAFAIVTDALDPSRARSLSLRVQVGLHF